jgi:hypothetical protein
MMQSVRRVRATKPGSRRNDQSMPKARGKKERDSSRPSPQGEENRQLLCFSSPTMLGHRLPLSSRPLLALPVASIIVCMEESS